MHYANVKPCNCACVQCMCVNAGVGGWLVSGLEIEGRAMQRPGQAANQQQPDRQEPAFEPTLNRRESSMGALVERKSSGLDSTAYSALQDTKAKGPVSSMCEKTASSLPVSASGLQKSKQEVGQDGKPRRKQAL